MNRAHPGAIFRPLLALAVCCAAMAIPASNALAGLALAEAERLALASDPAVRSIQSRKQALEELAVAARELPDPMLKMGLMSLPVDSFELGQEPMTQAQIGLMQKFPRGRSRELRSEQLGENARMLDETARDQELRILLAVREDYLEVLKQSHLAAINAEAIRVFTDFSDITRDYYATGRVHQQDVLQAAVELAKAEERARQFGEEEARARARLQSWIGDAARQDFEQEWPEFTDPTPARELAESLQQHPRVQALHQRAIASETGVDIAREQYKPEFSVEVTYGGRGGTNPDGSSRPDLLSLMLLVDVPLFQENRQDRQLAASIADSSAAMFDRDDMYRRLRSEAEMHAATLRHQRERLVLFEQSILPEAEFSAQSSLNAYQSAVGDLTTLLRAQITEFDLQLEYARLQAEALKTRARLLYLQGESS